MPSVIAAQHENNVIASGKGTTQAYGVRCCLATCVGYLNQFQGRHSIAQEFCKPCLKFICTASEERTIGFYGFYDRFIDARIIMTEKVRRERCVIVDILIALNVVNLATLSVREHNTRHNLTVERHHPTGNVLTRFPNNCRRRYVCVFVEVHGALY